MEKTITITFKETGDETYPHTYTVQVSDGITYGMGINALVKVTDMFINKLEQSKREHEKNNLQLGTPPTSKENTGDGSINNITGTNDEHENNLRPV